jgi:probable HAF family extracellular repeat protein
MSLHERVARGSPMKNQAYPFSTRAAREDAMKYLAGLVTLLAVGAVSPAASAASLYTITDLGTLGGTNSYGQGINANGEVTGDSALLGNTRSHAFLYNGSRMLDLGTIAGAGSRGIAINPKGEVTGISGTTANTTQRAFLYDGAVMDDLGTLGGLESAGTAINATGEVAGWSDIAGNPSTGAGGPHALLYNRAGMIDLGTLGGTAGYATGINDTGEVTGYAFTSAEVFHAFLFDGTIMLDLGSLCGCSGVSEFDDSEAYGINASGHVAGVTRVPDQSYHAFLYNGMTMVDLGTLGGDESFAQAINDYDEVTGYANSPSRLGTYHAFVYENGVMLDLNNLIDPTDPLFGQIIFSSAPGINGAGQIVADGCYTSGPLAGKCHAFRLEPVPLFAGTPEKANGDGQSVSALAKPYGGLNAAAAALGYSSVEALQNAILAYCEG